MMTMGHGSGVVLMVTMGKGSRFIICYYYRMCGRKIKEGKCTLKPRMVLTITRHSCMTISDSTYRPHIS